MDKKILIVVGTRPNIIKITQFRECIESVSGIECKIIHTGQHYDDKLAGGFFTQLRTKPDLVLETRGTSQISQMAKMMVALEEVYRSEKPDMVLVPGDVNSTFVAAFVANRLGIRVGHIESGLRSWDMTMPEEVNRIITDVISDQFFITEPSGVENLLAAGVPEDRIHHVGNTMIDTLVAFEKEIDASEILADHGLIQGQYALCTFHRPSNVDAEADLRYTLEVLEMASERIQVVFPIHPRTLGRLKDFALEPRLRKNKRIIGLGSQSYLEFQKLIKHAKFVLTDSGGIQEETTFRQVPCLTLRPNTERPITSEIGSNTLLEFDLNQIAQAIDHIMANTYKTSEIPALWDGKATQRIVEILKQVL